MWRPGDFFHGQTVTVGGQEGDGVTFNFNFDSGQNWEGVIFGSCRGDLSDGFGEDGAINGAGNFRHCWKCWIFFNRHRGQGEGRVLTCHYDPRLSELHGYWRIWQRFHNIAEHASFNKDLTLSFDLGFDVELSRRFVVETCDRDQVIFGSDEQTAQHWNGWSR